MKMLKNSFILLSTLLLLAACGGNNNQGTETGDDAGQAEKKEVIKMGTSADFPPFESRDTEGNFIGFDIEIAQSIADELGYELEIVDMDFDGLIGAIQSNRVDMVMAGMSATEERKKNVDFSEPYHQSSEMFIMKPENKIEKLDDLNGKVIGVQLGTIQEEGLEELSEDYDFEVKKIDRAVLLVEEINSNRIDLAYLDQDVALDFIENRDLAGMEDPTSSPEYAIAFPKESDLIAEVNEALQKLEESGKLDELREKWLKGKDEDESSEEESNEDESAE